MLRKSLSELASASPAQLMDERYRKFRAMGAFFRETVAAAR